MDSTDTALIGAASAAVALIGREVTAFVVSRWKHGLDTTKEDREDRIIDQKFLDYLNQQAQKLITKLDGDLQAVRAQVDKLQTEHIKCQEDNALLKARVVILENQKEVLEKKVASLEAAMNGYGPDAGRLGHDQTGRAAN